MARTPSQIGDKGCSYGDTLTNADIVGQQTVSFSSFGTVGFGKTFGFSIVRKFDILKTLYLQIQFPAISAAAGDTVAWAADLPYAMIDQVAFLVNQVPLEQKSGRSLALFSSLNTDDVLKLRDELKSRQVTTLKTSHPAFTLWLPIRLGWEHTPVQELDNTICDGFPLSAIPYGSIKLNLSLAEFSRLYVTGNGGTPTKDGQESMSLWGSGIKLNTSARLQLGRVPTRLQFESVKETVQQVQLPSDRVVIQSGINTREIVVTAELPSLTSAPKNQILNFTSRDATLVADGSKDNLIESFSVGDEYSSVTDPIYYRVAQPSMKYSRPFPFHALLYSFGVGTDDLPGGSPLPRYTNITLNMSFNGSELPLLRTYSINYLSLLFVSGGILIAN